MLQHAWNRPQLRFDLFISISESTLSSFLLPPPCVHTAEMHVDSAGR